MLNTVGPLHVTPKDWNWSSFPVWQIKAGLNLRDNIESFMPFDRWLTTFSTLIVSVLVSVLLCNWYFFPFIPYYLSEGSSFSKEISILGFLEEADRVCPLQQQVSRISAGLRRQFSNALSGKTLAFVGDSRMRDIFCFLRSLIQGHTPKNYTAFYHDAIFRQQKFNLTLLFYWRRYPDTELQRLLAKWELAVEEVPTYIILQMGAWSVDRHGGSNLANFTKGIQEALDKLANFPHNRTTTVWMQTLPVNPTTSWPSWVKRNNASLYVEMFGERIKSLVQPAIEIGSRPTGLAFSSHATTPKKSGSPVLLWSAAHDVALKRLDLYRDHVHPGLLLVQQFVCHLLTSIGVFDETDYYRHSETKPG